MDAAVVVAAVVAMAAAVFGIARTQNRPLMIVLVILIPVLAVGIGGWWIFLRPDVQASVMVYAPNSPDGKTEFIIDVPNTRVEMTGITHSFHPQVSEAELFEAMRRQHPGTVVADAVASVVEDNQRYLLYVEPSVPNLCVLEAEAIALMRDDATYFVPFPVRSITDLAVDEWGVESSCDRTCLTEYYRAFSNVRVDGGTFAITLPSGTFTLEDVGKSTYQVSRH